MSEIKQKLLSDMKSAMKSGEKKKLQTIRLMLAAVKQIEVDERIEVSDERMLVVLDKLAKQRKESISQFEKAGRDDLKEIEVFEHGIIAKYLPEPLSESEIAAQIEQAVTESGASSMQDMGKVMAILKPKFQGRADMGAVSQLIKAKLAG